MKLLIIGGGRMGMRHAQGALDIPVFDEICIADISAQSLENARNELGTHANSGKLRLTDPAEIGNYTADIVIIATTALNRLNTCKMALAANPKYVLIEKPIAQSYKDALAIAELFDNSDAIASVNLSYRLYPFYNQLKHDMDNWPQFAGTKNIVFNGGAVGIGVNGIHQIDLLFYLFNAYKGEFTAGEIEETLIASGRGAQFMDFGGWANFNFYDENDKRLGRGTISLSSVSSVFGGWDIVGSNARVRLNPFEAERINIVRKEDSTMPAYRYQADYLQPEVIKFELPQIPELTKNWISNIIAGNNILPTVKQVLPSHKLMFDWLATSKTHKDVFPIA